MGGGYEYQRPISNGGQKNLKHEGTDVINLITFPQRNLNRSFIPFAINTQNRFRDFAPNEPRSGSSQAWGS